MAGGEGAGAGAGNSSARRAPARCGSAATSATSPEPRCRRCTSPRASRGSSRSMAIAPDRVRRARPLLGTFVEIAASGRPRSELESAIDLAFAAVAKVHRLMSFHEHESDVGRLNRDAHASSVAVDACTFEVLRTSLDLHRRSGGIFDVTIAPVLQTMGMLPGAEPDASRDLPGCP